MWAGEGNALLPIRLSNGVGAARDLVALCIDDRLRPVQGVRNHAMKKSLYM
jgi:hypothetical protein